MLDVGMFMYAGLLVLAMWRCVCFYRCCGCWLSFLNYTSLLYVMLVAFLAYSCQRFYTIVRDPLDPEFQSLWSIEWLRTFVIVAPGAVCATVVMSWFQAEAHVFEIRKRVGADFHDRAVQIIALPAVFGVMVMAAMVPIVELATGNVDSSVLMNPIGADLQAVFHDKMQSVISRLHGDVSDVPSGSHSASAAAGAALRAVTGAGNQTAQLAWRDLEQYSMWRYETCFYVADLFEAWALYQFGCLALDLIGASYKSSSASRELTASHSAVRSLSWLGTITFVLVCLAQTACSLWPYIGGAQEKQHMIMAAFQVAGFFASSVAIYNVFVVERAFHDQLAPCSPVLKFLSVKILVSLAFFQRGILVLLQACNQMLPSVAQRIVRYVPLLGDLLNLSEVQMHLFYPALILFECLLAALMHLWAWTASEEWYAVSEDFYVEASETTALLENDNAKHHSSAHV
eukprot:TRINITY_DN6154_c0_g3_i1.p1 TRINITY_DN6154_c0_g3~~TRINITY_DN6154_c0_g3_i1.p1  ORF type:complete len:457 (-),score=84.64 TRINITY_DN6154_c0_g3_i1:317-1687(-)